ncbi:MAG: phenylalanine--tRNA ligase subunit beta [Alphaproteobacteria bacterium]|nr:phenylalanine--tRNA ligase subunit beta [Alphaproteobacteria bacterium]
MRFSFDWLKKHLDTNLSINQIADRLTSIGLEVEEVVNPSEIFKNFRLAQIKTAEKHPDADKLQVCKVVDGDGREYQIVCGAKNARAGLKTVLATPGAVIPASGDVLKKNKLRGAVSEGMMCSYHELAIPSKDDGIIELDPNTDLSLSVGEALNYGGGFIDVSVTPNRGDCFSVKGIARDLAAAEAGSFVKPSCVKNDAAFKFPIEIDCMRSDACQQYAPVIAFRMIRGVKNAESPDWLKSDLQAAGLNSVSLIVDLANWMMLDSGRPLHIYDADKIDGVLSVRFAKPKEEFIDLKGNRYELRQDMLVSADNKGVLCLMGVMGSDRAACTMETKNILIESALFDPIFISKTGTFLNILSDSRTRFERGIDRASAVSGLEAATKLLLDNCGGSASDIFVVGSEPKNDVTARLTKAKLNSISGYEIDWNIAKTILKKLGLKEISSSDNELTVEIPSWRNDLKIEEDLIEEILRINGYDKVREAKFDEVVAVNDRKLERMKTNINVIRLLASCGLSEVVSYSFIKSAVAEEFKENKKLITLINPISSDMNTLRSSVIPSLLLAAIRSLNYGQEKIGVCESGSIFYDDCKQSSCIAGLRAGAFSDRNWLQQARVVDAFDAKRDMLVALSGFGIGENNISIESTAPSYYHPSRSGTIIYRKKPIGFFGELHPKINKLFGISEKVVCFELIADDLSVSDKKQPYQEKVFPKINRDFAFLFDARASVGNIVNAIRKLDSRISSADIFDCFEVGLTKKSIGLTVTLEAPDRTLTDDEASEVSNKILEFVAKEGGELRTK